jgi:hypothetical protein
VRRSFLDCLALHLIRGKEVALQHDAVVEHRPENPTQSKLTRGEKVRAERIRRAWTQEDHTEFAEVGVLLFRLFFRNR